MQKALKIESSRVEKYYVQIVSNGEYDSKLFLIFELLFFFFFFFFF
jgi:hypothetical protein